MRVREDLGCLVNVFSLNFFNTMVFKLRNERGVGNMMTPLKRLLMGFLRSYVMVRHHESRASINTYRNVRL